MNFFFEIVFFLGREMMSNNGFFFVCFRGERGNG